MGKLLRWTVKDVADVIDRMVANDFDCLMYVEGNRGCGKSTLVYKICSRLKSVKPFNPWRDLYYAQGDVLKALESLKKQIIFADEFINVAYKRDFYEQLQKKVIKAINMFRDSCNVIIGCIPNFEDLDTDLKKLCKLRITVLRRGIALVHTKIPSIYSRDPWDTKNNFKIEQKWTAKGIVKPRYSQLTTVRGILTFNDLTAKQKEEYKKIKVQKRYQACNIEEEKSKDEFYDRLMDRIKRGNLTPKMFNEICLISGKKISAARKRCNELLRESGSNKTLKDYVNDNNKVKKKDSLGFAK